MERNLLWSALAVGMLGWLYCWLKAGARRSDEVPQREKLPPSLLYLAVALPLFVFFVTLPESPPFAAGHGFGRGFLLGSIGALLAMMVILRAASTLPSLLAPQFAALVIVTLPLLFLRATIIDSLLGVACGWIAVTLVLVQAMSTPASRVASAGGAGFAITLCAVSAMGVYRDFLMPDIVRGTWSALAVAFAAGVPITVLFSEQLRTRLLRGHSAWINIALSVAGVAAPLLLLANLLSSKVITQPRFSMVVAVGLLAGLILWWAAQVENADLPPDTPSTSLVLLGGFVMLAAVVVAFGLLQGFGIGLMILAAWPAIGLALQLSEARSTPAASKDVVLRLLPFFLFGVILLVERLFEQRFRADLRGVAITDYYALLGFLLGAGLPSLLAGWLRPGNSLSTLWLRLVVTGVAVLAIPAILMILWGVKTSFALLFGLALACLLNRNVLPAIALNASLLAIAIALLVAQWTHHLMPLTEMTRTERLRALGMVIVVLLIFVIVEELLTRLGRRKNLPVEGAAS